MTDSLVFRATERLVYGYVDSRADYGVIAVWPRSTAPYALTAGDALSRGYCMERWALDHPDNNGWLFLETANPRLFGF